ncbi:MAG TPA: hypothetical protein VMH04_01270 [Candidatus Solibacter sp.]|nr:hypothetical protein [Candidatus Solibacter sp.]
MRQVLLLSVLFLGVTWASAQTSPSQSSSPDASPTAAGQTSTSGHTSVQGCLSGSDGKYTLTDKSGTAYNLTGDTSKLADHVGHEIKVTGSTGAASGSSATSTGSSTSGQSLDVSSVKMVSKTCESGGGMAK